MWIIRQSSVNGLDGSAPTDARRSFGNLVVVQIDPPLKSVAAGALHQNSGRTTCGDALSDRRTRFRMIFAVCNFIEKKGPTFLGILESAEYFPEL